ncbi:MAG: DUF5060 domain-containing protein [Fimbriimonas sp.]
MLSLIAVAAISGQRQTVIESPYRQNKPLAIRSVERDSQSIPRFGVLEFRVKIEASYDNPFDSTQFTLDARVTPPIGDPYVVPGFLYRPMTRELAADEEQVKPSGEAEWRVRFSPKIEGVHQVRMTAKDKSGTVTAEPISITATTANRRGFVMVSPKDSRYFAFADGTSYWPIGTNICWGGGKGTYSYDDWLPKYAENGVNYGRLWLSPSWTSFALEQPGKAAEGKGMGQFDLGNAWRLDYVMDLARRHDIQMMLCIDSYNILRPRDAHPWWEKTPHNSDNGGPLRIPTDFWSDEKMEKFYKDKLRYIVARYGAYSNTMSWEFWNEVDLTDDFEVARVRDWHRRMAQYLKSIDPYDHMVTTSAASTMGFRELDMLGELDYFQTHHYGGDPALTTVIQQSRKGGQGRPHYVGEIGADASGAQDDPKGYQVHDPMWAAIGTGSSGTAMSWWWDSLIAPNNLYSLFAPVEAFVNDVDWQAEGFKQTTPTFAFQNPPKVAPVKDLVYRGGPIEWRASSLNQPLTVTIRNSKVSGPAALAGIQHGLGNHRDLNNPVTFDVQLDKPTRFDVEVGDVSGYGGANLRIWLDDNLVLSKDFTDPDGDEKTDTLKQFAGDYGFTIPGGRHTVRVQNTGRDWFMAGFRFTGLLRQTKPAIQAWTVVGETKALAWLRRESRDWLTAEKGQPGMAAASVMGLTGLASGPWKAEVWDTWSGKVLSTSTITVPVSGRVRVNVPAFAGDIALKLSKQ